MRLDHKPLPRVKVEVHPSNTDQAYFTGFTDATGRVAVRKVPPGDYWIRVSYFGISAGYHCFHVRPDSSLRSKGRLNYQWGDYGISMRVVTGQIRAWTPGTGGVPLWNMTHGTHVPIAGVIASLQNATTGEAFSTASDSLGDFAFPAVPDGTYVLHLEGGSTDAYDPTDLVITVGKSAKRERLTLTRQETGCGGITLQPEWK